MVLPPKEVATLLQERCRRLEAALAQAKSLKEHRAGENVPRLFLLDVDYRARLLEAEQAWVKTLLAEIAADSLDGLGVWRRWHGDGVATRAEGTAAAAKDNAGK